MDGPHTMHPTVPAAPAPPRQPWPGNPGFALVRSGSAGPWRRIGSEPVLGCDTDTRSGGTLRIYLDADACPVKEQVYKVADRYDVDLAVVANAYLRTPDGVRLVVVAGDIDAADDWIAERAEAGDLVLTADIPLAARVIANGVRCLDFRGGEFNPSRIGDALAARDLNAHLRALGIAGHGPAAFTPKDRSRFASALDSAVQQMRAVARRQAASAASESREPEG